MQNEDFDECLLDSEDVKIVAAPAIHDHYLRFVAAFGVNSFESCNIDANERRGRQSVTSYVQEKQGYGILGGFEDCVAIVAVVYQKETYGGPLQYVAWSPIDEFELYKGWPGDEAILKYGDWLPRGLYAYGWWRDEILALGLFSDDEGKDLIRQKDANYQNLKREHRSHRRMNMLPLDYRGKIH